MFLSERQESSAILYLCVVASPTRSRGFRMLTFFGIALRSFFSVVLDRVASCRFFAFEIASVDMIPYPPPLVII